MASAGCVVWLLFCSALIITAPSILSDAASTFNFDNDFSVSWASDKVKLLDGGQTLQLILEETSGGAGFVSKKSYLFGSIDMEIKLVPGDSAGTVTAYYLSSDPDTKDHDEVDFEFLGNVSGEPYIVQTNIFANGVGGREQRIYLWFDPTADYHTYSIKWTKKHIVQLVDGVPIRVYTSASNDDFNFPHKKPMRLYSSIWNGDSWATRGGQVKINWSHAPFIASYRGFHQEACAANPADAAAIAACQASAGNNLDDATGGSNAVDRDKLDWVKSKYLIYDYCTDTGRYPEVPSECARN